jgi:hypothetical protein
MPAKTIEKFVYTSSVAFGNLHTSAGTAGQEKVCRVALRRIDHVKAALTQWTIEGGVLEYLFINQSIKKEKLL